MKTLFDRFCIEEKGAGLVEYTLILTLIAVACAVILSGLGTQIVTRLTSVQTAI